MNLGHHFADALRNLHVPHTRHEAPLPLPHAALLETPEEREASPERNAIRPLRHCSAGCVRLRDSRLLGAEATGIPLSL